jgi:hypothetical protein
MNPFAKKPAPAPKPEPRKWDIPEKSHEKILRLIADPNSNTPVGRYNFYKELGKIVPETVGVNCVVDLKVGGVPYVVEVIA